jgi:hypothetical protein
VIQTLGTAGLPATERQVWPRLRERTRFQFRENLLEDALEFVHVQDDRVEAPLDEP